jgi:hypothetical protein
MTNNSQAMPSAEVQNASSSSNNNNHTLVWRHNCVKHPRRELKMEEKRTIIFWWSGQKYNEITLKNNDLIFEEINCMEFSIIYFDILIIFENSRGYLILIPNQNTEYNSLNIFLNYNDKLANFKTIQHF